MKNIIKIIVSISVFMFFFQNCETRTYDEISDNTPVKEVINYNLQVKPILQNNCVICHSSSGSASFAPLSTYNEAKTAIDGIIDRIQRPNGDPLKMPQGGSLSSTQIETIKKWKADGLLEN